MGSVEVLGVGAACSASAAVLALHAPFAKLAPAPIAWASSSCRRPRPRASAVICGGVLADGHARHVRWCAPTPARGRGFPDSTDRSSTRAAAETSTRASRDPGGSDDEANGENVNAAVVERVAVLVLAATGIPTSETETALAARPELIRALADASPDDDDDTVDRDRATASRRDARGGPRRAARGGDLAKISDAARDARASATRKDDGARRTFRAERRVASALRFLTREVGFSAADAADALRARGGDGFAVLAADVDETLRRAFAFTRAPRAAGGAGLGAAAAARAAKSDPRILLVDAETVRARFAWLTDVAGVRPVDAFATHAATHLGGGGERFSRVSSLVMLADSRSAAGVDARGAYDFLRAECALGASATRATLRKYPGVLTKDVARSMRPALLALRAHVSSEVAAKVIAKYPSVLTLLPETVEAKFFFLRETCALDGERINKLVSAAPSIVTLSVTRNLAPTFGFLAHELGLGEAGARTVLAKAPSVFGLRRENVGPKFAFFAERADRDAAVAIFTKAPSLLGTSLERNIAPTAWWIVDACACVGFGDGDDGDDARARRRESPLPRWILEGDVRRRADSRRAEKWDPRAVDVLVSCPSLLGMSVENKLAPTLRFLLSHFPNTPAPILFRAGTFSLRGHVAPRVELLAEAGLHSRWAPGTFLAWNVSAFCAKTGVSREAYEAKVLSCRTRDERGFGEGRRSSDPERRGTFLGGAKHRAGVGDDGMNASTSIRSAIRARAEASAPGRDEEPTPAERARARRAARRRSDTEKDGT